MDMFLAVLEDWFILFIKFLYVHSLVGVYIEKGFFKIGDLTSSAIRQGCRGHKGH